MRVSRAADTKSCVLMSSSRRALLSGEKDLVIVGAGVVHSSLRVVGLRVPRILDLGREVLISEGAWILV